MELRVVGLVRMSTSKSIDRGFRLLLACIVQQEAAGAVALADEGGGGGVHGGRGCGGTLRREGHLFWEGWGEMQVIRKDFFIFIFWVKERIYF